MLGEIYDVYFTGDPPASLRIHLVNAKPNQHIDFNIYYGQRQRMDVYVNDSYVLPINGFIDGAIIAYSQPPIDEPNHYRTVFDNLDQKTHGDHIYDELTRTMTITAKGPTSVDIRQTEVAMVQVGEDMMTENEFFGVDLVSLYAELLGMWRANIPVVDVITEN